MNRPRRLALLLVPLAFSLLSHALPGRAQTTEGSRFAFSDTTLLRDTLDLHFDRLFDLADSLRITPDTLRALSIRYRTRLARLVHLADSLRVPIDSVGAVLERERFNPLASSVTPRVTTFRYNSGYNIAQTSTSWTNGSDFNFVAGPLFMRNTTTIQMDRFQSTGQTSQRQTRDAVTEGGWKFSPNFSVGGRVNLDRFNSSNPNSIGNEAETKNEFQVSMRSRQHPGHGLRSDLNFFAGVLDLSNAQQIKRGASSDLNGNLRFERGRWLTHDFSGQVTANLAHTGLPSTPERATSHDLSTNLRGTLGLWSATPAALNLNYSIRRVVVETPQSVTVLDTIIVPDTTAFDTTLTSHQTLSLQRVRNNNSGADVALRLRRDRDRYLNLTSRYGNSQQFTVTQLNSETQRTDYGIGIDGRYLLAGWSLDGSFSNSYAQSRFPARALVGGQKVGYGESLRTSTIEASASRGFVGALVVKASGRVQLSAFRYYLIGSYPNPPVNRDSYQQNYRLETNYSKSVNLSSGIALDVTRSLAVNLPSSSAAANSETDTYRAEWRWSYRMLPGLTATQNNALSADYLKYNFVPRNNRLSLSYTTLTNLNATPSPHLTVDLTHNTRFLPSGNYRVEGDGLEYLSLSDETQDYTLRARIAYTPTPAISLVMSPDYLATRRDAAQETGLQTQRKSRSLNFSGGVSLNLPLGVKGRLTGDISRSYRGERSITYSTAGVPTLQPRTQADFWNGNLQLSWEL